MSLIKKINSDINNKNLTKENILDVKNIFDLPGVESVLKENSNTHLSSSQIKGLADYVREMMKLHKKDIDNKNEIEDTIRMALEYIAGFETADEKTIQDVVNRVVAVLKNG